jgi:hypothetical protein
MGREGFNILNDVDYSITTMCSIGGKSREFCCAAVRSIFAAVKKQWAVASGKERRG